ncbi:hypothetical protein JTE90_010479 [Oedothorax gibbosus]|uniref:Uncharacterized protein n=1 Tax=Oedothorax gibbosus TaxID=931172 RepID=A0AAV6W2V7_9ARAC|nr:hypothetical protein JTE90_010479 [Oedothorax gibbosus]
MFPASANLINVIEYFSTGIIIASTQLPTIQAAHGVMKTELLFLAKLSRAAVTSEAIAPAHWQPPPAQAFLGSWLAA